MDALVFDGYQAWGSNVALPVPFGMMAMTCVGVKNSLVASDRTIYNARVQIEYFYDGKPEFTINSALWWREPRGLVTASAVPIIDLDANESQRFPVYMQPVGATQLDPPYPQSAMDEHRQTRSLRPGRWLLKITVSADNVEPILGEIEFTLIREQGEERLRIATSGQYGAVRLPLLSPSMQLSETSAPSRFRRFGFPGLCFLIAFICWAIQKGDAAVNPTPNWLVGLLWYSLATILAVLGIWFWNQTAKRHIVLRISASVLVLALMFWLAFGPLKQEYLREHMPPVTQPVRTPIQPASPELIPGMPGRS